MMPSPAARTIPTATLAAPAPLATRRRPVSWTKLIWVTWRQHRAGLAGAATLLGALSLYMLIFGLQISNAYAKIASCHPAGSTACQQLANAFSRSYWGGGTGSVIEAGGAQEISVLLLVVPVLLGVFLGAPLVARELETGTFRFAWTQGCGRVRWTVTKLALLAAVLTGAAWAFSELFSWYYHPFLALHLTTEFLPIVFALRGVDFAAWTLAAFAIAAFAGAAIRRTVPAMAAALAAWTVLDVLTTLVLRPHYQAPLTIRGGAPFQQPSSLGNAWVVGQWLTGPDGKTVSQATASNLMQHAPASVQNSPDPNAVSAWLGQHRYVQWWAYQPVSRFWHFQFIEGGWLLVLAILLGGATVWLVRHRAA
jgi:hypothetical protein